MINNQALIKYIVNAFFIVKFYLHMYLSVFIRVEGVKVILFLAEILTSLFSYCG